MFLLHVDLKVPGSATFPQADSTWPVLILTATELVINESKLIRQLWGECSRSHSLISITSRNPKDNPFILPNLPS